MTTSTAKQVSLPIAAPQRSSASSIDDAVEASRHHDIVIGMVGHAGAGTGEIARKLRSTLESGGYDVESIRLSEVIVALAAEAGWVRSPELSSENKSHPSVRRLELLQEAGTWLRSRASEILAARAIQRIHDSRQQTRSGRKAFILDSLKHPAEILLLRRIYGDGFYAVGVICSRTERVSRLARKYAGARSNQLEACVDRDEEEEIPEGQQVRDTIHLSDFFVANERPSGHDVRDGSDKLSEGLTRFVSMMIEPQSVIRATAEESGMFAAWSAGLRSACLSRQVGAAVVDPRDGSVMATGCNDVPRFGGGLYHDGADDHRCYRDNGDRGAPHCRNDAQKKSMYDDLERALRAANLLRAESSSDEVQGVLRKSRIRHLIEFSRAVHAEVDALISLARAGGGSPRGATLYTTTYPCHLCARHIVAAGIHRVVYIEPYAKSLASKLHADAIVDATGPDDGPVGANKVRFEMFTGVAPRRYAALFQKRIQLKDSSGVVRGPTDAYHSSPVYSYGSPELERVVIDSIPKLMPTENPA